MREKLLVTVTALMMLAGCGVKKMRDLTRKMAEEAARAAKEAAREAEEAPAAAAAEEEAAGEAEEEEFAFPAKGVAAVEDALSKGDPMLSEETWGKIVKAGAELAAAMADFEKLTEGEGTPDQLKGIKERVLAAIEKAGIKDVEELKEMGDKLRRVFTLHMHLANLEGVMAMSAEFKKDAGAHALVGLAGGEEAVKAARAAGQAQADYLKGELQGKAYTKKDVELYCKYKSSNSKEVDAFLAVSLMADMLLAQ